MLAGGTFDLSDGNCDRQNGLHTHFTRQWSSVRFTWRWRSVWTCLQWARRYVGKAGDRLIGWPCVKRFRVLFVGWCTAWTGRTPRCPTIRGSLCSRRWERSCTQRTFLSVCPREPLTSSDTHTRSVRTAWANQANQAPFKLYGKWL